MKDEGRGRFSGVSQFAIGPSEDEIRDLDRRAPRGAAGFFTVAFAAWGANGGFTAGALAAEGLAGFCGSGAGAPTDSTRFTFANFGIGTVAFAVRPECSVAALRSGAVALFAAGFVGEDFFATAFLGTGTEAPRFGLAPRFASDLVADAVFLATFLTVAFTRLLTDFVAGTGFRALTAAFRALTAGFRGFGGAVFFAFAAFRAPGDETLVAGFPLGPLPLAFNDLADPEAAFRAPDL